MAEDGAESAYVLSTERESAASMGSPYQREQAEVDPNPLKSRGSTQGTDQTLSVTAHE